MRTAGIIAEYNPFHNGHRHHIEATRAALGGDTGIVCVMSGNWVQRADAALCDKWTRAGMALRGGADLILELPSLWALSSAEGFAEGGVSILNATGVVDTLSFGSEAGALAPLLQTALTLSSTAYPAALRLQLDAGLSFPLARQRAATELLGQTADCLQSPNNNLGVEYLRALARLGSPLLPFTIPRRGAAHDSVLPCEGFASASQLRRALLVGAWDSLPPYLHTADIEALQTSGLASLSFAERAVFARLRTMKAEDFLFLPDCSAGLHHRLARAAMQSGNLEQLYSMAKSRRYTHARIRRLVLWAFLGLRASDRPIAPPYLRVLGMNRRGQTLLHEMKNCAKIPLLTKSAHIRKLSTEAQRLFALEATCTALYDLCRADFGKTPATEEYRTNPILLS